MRVVRIGRTMRGSLNTPRAVPARFQYHYHITASFVVITTNNKAFDAGFIKVALAKHIFGIRIRNAILFDEEIYRQLCGYQQFHTGGLRIFLKDILVKKYL